MSEIVTAVYEKGVLRPLSPLPLREHETVRIQLVYDADADVALAVADLVAEGAVSNPRGSSAIEPPSGEERRRVAEARGRAPGKSLSEIIIEDRVER